MKVEFYKHNLDDQDIQRLDEACRGVMLTTGAEVKAYLEYSAKFFVTLAPGAGPALWLG